MMNFKRERERRERERGRNINPRDQSRQGVRWFQKVWQEHIKLLQHQNSLKKKKENKRNK